MEKGISSKKIPLFQKNMKLKLYLADFGLFLSSPPPPHIPFIFKTDSNFGLIKLLNQINSIESEKLNRLKKYLLVHWK